MGGYALYVWSSFGSCLLLLIAESLLVRHRLHVVRQLLSRERLAATLDKDQSQS